MKPYLITKISLTSDPERKIICIFYDCMLTLQHKYKPHCDHTSTPHQHFVMLPVVCLCVSPAADARVGLWVTCALCA